MNIAPGSQVRLENGPVHRLSKGSTGQGRERSLNDWPLSPHVVDWISV